MILDNMMKTLLLTIGFILIIVKRVKLSSSEASFNLVNEDSNVASEGKTQYSLMLHEAKMPK